MINWFVGWLKNWDIVRALDKVIFNMRISFVIWSFVLLREYIKNGEWIESMFIFIFLMVSTSLLYCTIEEMIENNNENK